VEVMWAVGWSIADINNCHPWWHSLAPTDLGWDWLHSTGLHWRHVIAVSKEIWLFFMYQTCCHYFSSTNVHTEIFSCAGHQFIKPVPFLLSSCTCPQSCCLLSLSHLSLHPTITFSVLL
jgi:hypothetical protein